MGKTIISTNNTCTGRCHLHKHQFGKKLISHFAMAYKNRHINDSTGSLAIPGPLKYSGPPSISYSMSVILKRQGKSRYFSDIATWIRYNQARDLAPTMLLWRIWWTCQRYFSLP